MQKKTVKETIESCFEEHITETTVDEAIAALNTFKKKYPNHELYIEGHTRYEHTELILVGHRLETDKEFEKRKIRSDKARKAAKKRKLRAKEKRRKEYEKLKKEFEKEG